MVKGVFILTLNPFFLDELCKSLLFVPLSMLAQHVAARTCTCHCCHDVSGKKSCFTSEVQASLAWIRMLSQVKQVVLQW